MRTTLTLEDDVMAQIDGLRRSRRESLKDLVNQALRLGLAQLQGLGETPSQPYRQPAESLGGCRLSSIDDVAGVLEFAEGDGLR